MKKFLRKITPGFIFRIYYYGLAVLAALRYGFPSRKMIVIGVTGTKGKTSTINFIWATLMAGGFKTGIISTANIRIGDREFLNKYHMTMPGRFTIQKLMKEMSASGCTYCLVETTSEGIQQYRHIGIAYDIGIFTNLTPEHLPSHGGSFERYKEMKRRMFRHLSSHRKVLARKPVEKIIIANKDSEHADYYLNNQADRKISFGLVDKGADYVADNVQETDYGVTFDVNGISFSLGILGKFNVYNALPAIIIARNAGVSDAMIQKGLIGLAVIPGRMEKINEGQPFTVIVDYAHEKQSITNVLTTAREISKGKGRIIILLGAEGGGRDKAKRPIMGELSATMADYVVVSNVDPYDDDPKEILEDIATVAERFGKVRERNLFVIEDRRLGIRKAMSLAAANDVVLITGKGAEQSMIVGGVSLSWDDRTIVREELKLLN